jgi:MFS family permease
VVLTILFFALESKRTAPLIRLQLLRIRNVLAANLILLLTTAVMLLFFYAVVYYATNPSTFGLNLGIIATGLTIAPACVAMIVEGPALGAMMRRTGPKPVLVLGAGLQVIGALLFLGFRGTRLDVIIDSVILLAGTVSLLVSASNMIATSLPKESISVGFGMNMIFRNLGGAIGPVAATVIMTTYVGQYFVGGRVTELFFANSTAFNVIAYIAIILSVIIFAISLIAENYTFKENISKLSHSPRKLSADG